MPRKKKTKATKKKINPLKPKIVIDRISGEIGLEIFGKIIQGITINDFQYNPNQRSNNLLGNAYGGSFDIRGRRAITARVDMSDLSLEYR